MGKVIDPYAAMQPKALKLTAKELLTLSFVQDKVETHDDFLLRVMHECSGMIDDPEAKPKHIKYVTPEELLAVEIGPVQNAQVEFVEWAKLEAEYFAASAA